MLFPFYSVLTAALRSRFEDAVPRYVFAFHTGCFLHTYILEKLLVLVYSGNALGMRSIVYRNPGTCTAVKTNQIFLGTRNSTWTSWTQIWLLTHITRPSALSSDAVPRLRLVVGSEQSDESNAARNSDYLLLGNVSSTSHARQNIFFTISPSRTTLVPINCLNAVLHPDQLIYLSICFRHFGRIAWQITSTPRQELNHEVNVFFFFPMSLVGILAETIENQLNSYHIRIEVWKLKRFIIVGYARKSSLASTTNDERARCLARIISILKIRSRRIVFLFPGGLLFETHSSQWRWRIWCHYRLRLWWWYTRWRSKCISRRSFSVVICSLDMLSYLRHSKSPVVLVCITYADLTTNPYDLL